MEHQLYTDLVSHSNPHVRPVANHNDTVLVQVQVRIVQIEDLVSLPRLIETTNETV